MRLVAKRTLRIPNRTERRSRRWAAERIPWSVRKRIIGSRPKRSLLLIRVPLLALLPLLTLLPLLALLTLLVKNGYEFPFVVLLPVVVDHERFFVAVRRDADNSAGTTLNARSSTAAAEGTLPGRLWITLRAQLTLLTLQALLSLRSLLPEACLELRPLRSYSRLAGRIALLSAGLSTDPLLAANLRQRLQRLQT